MEKMQGRREISEFFLILGELTKNEKVIWNIW